MSQWMLSRVTDYWDQPAGAEISNGAIFRMSRALADEGSGDLARHLEDLAKAVARHVEALGNDGLLLAAACVMDDLYKAALGGVWDEYVGHYLNVSSTAFWEAVRSRGYSVHFVIHNHFENTEVGMRGPAKWFKFWFNTAGLNYVCPQMVAQMLMRSDGVEPDELQISLPRYMDEARLLATRAAAGWQSSFDHFVYLDTDGDDESLRIPLSAAQQPGVLLVFRDEAPVKGSRIRVVDPPGPRS